MFKKAFLPFLLLLFFANFTKAQILIIDNNDSSDYQKKAVFSGNIALSLEGDKQKKLLLDATNILNLQLQKNKELWIFAASYRFTTNDQQQFLNAGFAHLRWRHLYKDVFQKESYLQYNWDKNIGLQKRFVTGVNLRYDFLRRKHHQFTIGAGPMYEYEMWNYAAVDSSLIPANQANVVTGKLKLNQYLKWEGNVSDNTVVSAAVFYQTPFSKLYKTYRLAANIKAEIGISKRFKISTAFNSMYDDTPVVPIFKFYYNFSNSLIYSF